MGTKKQRRQKEKGHKDVLQLIFEHKAPYCSIPFDSYQWPHNHLCDVTWPDVWLQSKETSFIIHQPLKFSFSGLKRVIYHQKKYILGSGWREKCFFKWREGERKAHKKWVFKKKHQNVVDDDEELMQLRRIIYCSLTIRNYYVICFLVQIQTKNKHTQWIKGVP